MRLFEPSKSAKAFGDKSGRYFFGQVTSTSFDTNSPEELGSITYRFLSDIEGITRGTAYPLFPGVKNIPLVDEIILCVIAPSELQEASGKFNKAYYVSSVNIWNHPQHSGYTREKNEIALHPNFGELADINPMLPFPGDIIFEGRRGQSIRFSESQTGTPWFSTGSGAPVIAIVNGQVSTEEGFSYVTEDINSDAASIYLTSNNSLPFSGSYAKSTSISGSFSSPSDYLGNQVFINSGRLYFNANTERVLINGTVGVGLSGQEINIDGVSKIVLDAPKTYLTATSRNEKQRGVLGDSLASELHTLYSDLQKVMNELGVLASTVGYAPLTQVASEVLTSLEIRQTKLKSKILTDRVFLSK